MELQKLPVGLGGIMLSSPSRRQPDSMHRNPFATPPAVDRLLHRPQSPAGSLRNGTVFVSPLGRPLPTVRRRMTVKSVLSQPASLIRRLNPTWAHQTVWPASSTGKFPQGGCRSTFTANQFSRQLKRAATCSGSCCCTVRGAMMQLDRHADDLHCLHYFQGSLVRLPFLRGLWY